VRTTCLRHALWLLALVLSTAVSAQQVLPRFRSAADLVRVDVSVQRDGRPVLGLIGADFQIFDNEVLQDVADFSYGKLPIDVTLALDVSSSVSGQLLNSLRQSVEQLKSRLRSDDRLKLMAFNMRVRRLVNFTEQADTRAAFDGLSGAGSTSIFDAMSVALTSETAADRRQLLIVFSDGNDTSSITDPDVLSAVAMRTTPTMAFVGPLRGPGMTESRLPVTRSVGAAAVGQPQLPLGAPESMSVVRSYSAGSPLWQVYARLAAETGGVVVSMPDNRGTNLTGTFGKVLDDFRASYVLHFVPTGVARKGFHALRVAVPKTERAEIRARRGYVED